MNGSRRTVSIVRDRYSPRPHPVTGRIPVRASRSLVVVAAGVVLGLPLGAPGQTQTAPAFATTQARRAQDSVATLDELRRLRHRFLTRLGLKTRGRSDGPTGFMNFSCEIRVVAYCFGPRNGDVPFGSWAMFPVGGSLADRTVIRQSVNDLRALTAEFLADLDRLGARIPGDRWIAGTRVYVLIERANLIAANQAARRCRSDRWWCAALAGHTFAVAGNYAAADSAFATALANMSEERRCEWNDVSLLLENDDARDRFRAMSCVERDAVAERLWWLADPLYVMPGNERRTAHYSRQVFDQLVHDWNDRPPPLERGPCAAELRARMRQGDAPTPGREEPSLPPPPDTDESRYHRNRVRFSAIGHHHMVIRMGIPDYSFMESWVRCADGLPLTLYQFADPRYHFVPALDAALDPLRARPDHWEVDARSPSELYRASFGRFVQLDHQAAFFRRGDSALVVAVTDVAQDSLLPESAVLASALVLARNERDPPQIVHSPMLPRATYAVVTRPDSLVMSLEVLTRPGGAGRVRYATGPPPMPGQRVTLSDILLVEPRAALPAALDAAVSTAMPTTAIADSTIGLFWEVYGAVPGDTLRLTASMSEHASTGIARLGQMLGVVARSDSSRVTWTETRVPDGGIMPQAVGLDLRTLGRGKYTLRLEVAVPGQLPVSVARELEIVR